MISNVKYIVRPDGAMPEYETLNEYDKRITHTSYQELIWELHRPALSVVAITQALLEITEDTYHLLQEGRRINVLYKPFTLSKEQDPGLVDNLVHTLITTPPKQIEPRWFLRCLAQGNGVRNTLDAVVTVLAKSKSTNNQAAIAARIQTIITSVHALQGYQVEARIHEVWAQQQAAYEALTPEELAAYNALTPEELAEHSF